MAEVSASALAKKLDNAGLTDEEKAALGAIVVSALNGANDTEGFLLGLTSGPAAVGAGTGGAVAALPTLNVPSSLSVGQVTSWATGVASNPIGTAQWALGDVFGTLSGATISGIGGTNLAIVA